MKRKVTAVPEYGVNPDRSLAACLENPAGTDFTENFDEQVGSIGKETGQFSRLASGGLA
jgi:hypothetical protein